MPNVDVDITIRAPVDEIWRAVNDIEAYPQFMANVRSVAVVSDDGKERVSNWSVLLKGSILEWSEREWVDDEAHRVTFQQIDGDLDLFAGYWLVQDAGGGASTALLSVEFEIGIPLLADMLNPVASRALRENSEHMLREIERQVRGNPMTARSAVRVLVTGATGVVGSEIVHVLRSQDNVEVTGVARRPDPKAGVIGWSMGSEQCPTELARPWDVVVHAAANTRWSMTPEEAFSANVCSVEALADVMGSSTHLVSLSTAHVEGLRGSVASDDLADYRNTYEWSKAAGERLILAKYHDATIVRFPIVLGRRTDGHIRRFNGFYKLLRALASGLVPAIVALPDAYLDVVPVDDVAHHVTVAAIGPRRAGSRLVSLGRGSEARRVSEVLDLFFSTVDEWRAGRGIDPLPRPPLLSPERWDRFFLPFARQHLSPVQLRTIEVFSEFRPYMCLEEPFGCTDFIEDPGDALVKTVRWWASRHPESASATPAPWS